MRKMLLTMWLVIGITVGACAEHPRAEHPKAEHPSAAEKAMTPADKVAGKLQSSGVITAQEVSLVNTSIVFLLENGATADETENIVKQAVIEAKAQGLKDEELAAKVKEAAQGYIAAKKAEHPTAGSEHPAAEHPKAEHPGR